jgi:hypothetical protein
MNRAEFITPKAASMMKAAIERAQGRTTMPRENPAKSRAEEERGRLLRRVEAGQALTLAEYVRAEEILAHPARAAA